MVSFVRENQNRSSAISSRRAQIRATTADEANMSIEAVLSTEQAVPMYSRQTWEVVDEILLASGRTTAEHVVLLDAHDRSSVSKVLGHIENIRTAEGTTDTVCLMLFDSEDDDAVKAFRKYAKLHVRDLSVGYQVLAYQIVEAGQSATIDGRTFTASSGRRLHIATSWRVDEGSCVPIGADSKAKARGEDPNNMTVQVSEEEIQALISKREKQSVSDVETESQNPAGDGTKERTVVMTTSVTVADETRQTPDELIAIGAQREAKRRSDIRALATGVSPEAVTAAVDDVTCTIDKARELFLKDLQAQRSAPPAGSDAPNIILSGGDKRRERDVNVHSLACAVAARMGVDVSAVGHRINTDPITGETTFEKPGYKNTARQQEFERNMERADKFRGIHSVDLCREALQIEKIDAPMERRALVSRAFSTPAVSTIYTQAMGAVLLQNLGQMIDSTLGWTKDVEAKSFKSQELHRLEGGPLKRRNRGKEANHASFADTMESYKVNEFASQLVIDRQDLIDDELGAWATALDEYARAVLSLRPDIVYAVLAANAALATDSVALFHSTHSNLQTGSALAAATLQSALTLLASQRGPGGLNLNLRDAFLITGEGLSFTAEQLTTSAEVRDTAAANGTNNPIRQRNIGTRSDSRISVGFTDPVTETAVAAAATTYYLAAANGAYGMHVGHLAGTNGMPLMRTSVLNSEGKFGLSLDVSHVVGAGVAGHQGLVKGIA